MIARSVLLLASLPTVALSATRSGHAEAEWAAASSSYEAGKPVQTGLRLRMDPGWHTYWSNPGEGGMKLDVSYELPEGWTASEPAHPVPIRFHTGDLPGFGYEGEVVFPITLTPPADAEGEAVLTLKVFWLTCDSSACIPGNADLTLTLGPGPAEPSPAAKWIQAALSRIPAAKAEWAQLDVKEQGANLVLTLTPGKEQSLDVAESDVFPATPQVVDAGAAIQFRKEGSGWVAQVPKSEYASGPPQELTLVIAGKAHPPVQLAWKASSPAE